MSRPSLSTSAPRRAAGAGLAEATHGRHGSWLPGGMRAEGDGARVYSRRRRAGGGKKGQGLGRALIRQRNKAARRWPSGAAARCRWSPSGTSTQCSSGPRRPTSSPRPRPSPPTPTSSSTRMRRGRRTSRGRGCERSRRPCTPAASGSRDVHHGINQMTVEELDANKRQAFLVWCRNLARIWWCQGRPASVFFIGRQHKTPASRCLLIWWRLQRTETPVYKENQKQHLTLCKILGVRAEPEIWCYSFGNWISKYFVMDIF